MKINRNLADTVAFQNSLSAIRKAQSEATSPTGNIVDQAANLVKADHTAKAGVKVVHIADEMRGQAIDIKA